MPPRAATSSALAVAVLALAACRHHQEAEPDAEVEAAPAAAQTEPTGPVRIVYPSAPGSFVKLVDDVAPSIVALRSSRKVVGGPAAAFPGVEDERALGTGFIVDRNGYILTNDRLIANAPEVVAVLHDGSERAARIAGRDPKLDVALLKIEASPDLVPLPLGDSDAVETGEWVVALGNPFGAGVTLSAGVVTRLESPAAVSNVAPRMDYYHAYLMTDAAVHAGNTGGPLINTAGEAIGIATAVEPDRRAPLSYAIPIARVRQILPMLQKEGKVTRAWLGVFVQPVTDEIARRLALPEARGAFVADVVASGPAHKAGIRRGDVILEFDDHAVNDKTLAHIAATTGVGRRIPVVISRSGQERTLELVSEKMPE